jgi:hypothetical protein
MTIYLLNTNPNNAVTETIPGEAFMSEKPKLNHLKIFGSITYDNTAYGKLLFVRYIDERKAYKLVDPCRNEVVARKDVRINKNVDLDHIDEDRFEASKL